MSEHRQLKAQTRALLTGLGTCPDEVAESLRSAGVHGVPRNNRSCAVALYLSVLMGSDPRVRSIKVGHCSLLIDTVSSPETPTLGPPAGPVTQARPSIRRRL